MSVNPIEENLRRLTMVQAIVRKEINTTNSLQKREVYRKKHEQISLEIHNLLKELKLELE